MPEEREQTEQAACFADAAGGVPVQGCRRAPDSHLTGVDGRKGEMGSRRPRDGDRAGPCRAARLSPVAGSSCIGTSFVCCLAFYPAMWRLFISVLVLLASSLAKDFLMQISDTKASRGCLDALGRS